MKGLLCVILSGAVCLSCVERASAEITFLHHFNDPASFDINPAFGDFAAGDKTATPSTTAPTHATGFFANNPNNGAMRVTATGQFLLFDGAGGNIQFTSPTEGGVTLGLWYKFEQGSSGGGAQLAVLGATSFDDDYLTLDQSWGPGGYERSVFRDGSSQFTTEGFGVARTVDEWSYIAVTIDLGNEEMAFYRYEADGSLVDEVVYESITVGGMNGDDGNNGWNLDSNPLSRIRILGGLWGGFSGLLVDEFSIDSRVLTPAEMTERVASMVAGNELQGPSITVNSDFDGNGIVDGQDFLIWQRGYGKADAMHLDGDANGDGNVDGLDLSAWREQFGSVSSPPGSHAIPEPASLPLLLLAAGAFLVRGVLRR